jgi:hypothetical protein
MTEYAQYAQSLGFDSQHHTHKKKAKQQTIKMAFLLFIYLWKDK